jgi:beta-glucosidase
MFMPSAAYLDPKLPVAERVRDLLSRLTIQEKLSQFMHAVDGIPRLGIAAYNFWSEGLHGVGRNGRATVFPQAIAMSATWNPTLVKAIGVAIGDEARAKFHETLRTKGKTGLYQGLTLWSPNINIFRDPRWGRGQETWGEDPFLTGNLATAYVQGLQGNDPKYLRVAACAKHFAVHSGPEKLRHSFNARVSRYDLYATYLPAFKKLVVDGKVEAVMGAYNRVLDEPACTSKLLIQDILRGEWGFGGHVVSDCWALTDVHEGHHYTAGPVETAALALKNGCDLSCGCTFDQLGDALERGLISLADIDQALSRVLTTRFKLGMFDPPEQVPYSSTPMSVVGSRKHRTLAYRAALQSAVLLKNKDQALPIGPQVKSIFVTGPAAASLDVLLGNYYGIHDQMSTLIEGIAGRAPEGIKLEYRPGCLWTQQSAVPYNRAVDEAISADLTIICAGTSPLMEGEEGESLLTAENGDRTQIELPIVQQKFIRELAEHGARIILVLTGGSPIALGEIADMVEAILFVWYPGQEGGRAVANLLFGDASPSGKLTLTFPKSTADLPPFEDYNMTGRTYRYASREPLFPFGFGLSYTSFKYQNLKIIPPVTPSRRLRVAVTLKNGGSCTAEEVAQLYVSALETSLPAPLSQLIAFKRVRLTPGQVKEIRFSVKPEKLMLFDEAGRQKLESGTYQLTAGGCSPGARGEALGAPQPAIVQFKIP